MPSEKTVGNKDRVNIVYKSASDNENKELPFKLLILGDFTVKDDAYPFAERNPIAVNRDNLEQVFRALGPKLELMVPADLLGQDDPPLIPVILEMKSLKDFQPEEIVAKVGPMNEAFQKRSQVMAAQRALMKNDALLSALNKVLEDPKKRERLRKELFSKE
ncbi:MAG: type VI secretion system contractile sheath small subunit [Deltaproteobacteria bacterium]|jgi:type VI secretion system protein ImpB|nr:type VI secretion system contractile sheath small subunit [Deltaproteobacteria bacterium]